MPPQQCPACGRFLKAALVAALTDEPTPCPRCEADLAVSMFATATVPTSVRPPDLAPESVRDDLADWDRGEVVDLERWLDDRPPYPVDAAVIGGAAVAGALLGAITLRRNGRGALAGGLAGAVAAAVLRRVWRLDR